HDIGSVGVDRGLNMQGRCAAAEADLQAAVVRLRLLIAAGRVLPSQHAADDRGFSDDVLQHDLQARKLNLAGGQVPVNLQSVVVHDVGQRLPLTVQRDLRHLAALQHAKNLLRDTGVAAQECRDRAYGGNVDVVPLNIDAAARRGLVELQA